MAGKSVKCRRPHRFSSAGRPIVLLKIADDVDDEILNVMPNAVWETLHVDAALAWSRLALPPNSAAAEIYPIAISISQYGGGSAACWSVLSSCLDMLAFKVKKAMETWPKERE